ncbi:uncharacterized protein LOC141601216 [Silene latifolia]|uniref:uncharacterized protein LOC141601216 n=1 Tax=Silene latifolia TaxID=37657 RepID=UPI003D77BECB
MPKLVGMEQAAFIPGRSLHENTMLTQSLIKGYTRKHLTPRCMLKVDISKAFDSLQWEFLKNMLLGLGFPMLFTRWILGCVTGAWYTLKLNGSNYGFFKGRSGVRQVRKATDTLQIFSYWSGLKASFEKTEAYFGGVSSQLKVLILQDTGLKEGQFPFRYLGLPLNPSRLTSPMYEALVLKIQTLAHSCASKFLSYAGKLQVINSIVFGLYNFWCGSLLLPKGICSAISVFCRQLFWGYNGGTKKQIFKSWQSICTPWEEGGFQVKDITAWNQASQSESLRGVLTARDTLISCLGGVHEAQSALNSCGAYGRFSVGKAYNLLRIKEHPTLCFRVVKSCLLLPRFKVILQLAIQRKLATTDLLNKRGWCLVNRCYLCKCQAESSRHLFFKCAYSFQVLSSVLSWFGVSFTTNQLHGLLIKAYNMKPRKHWRSRWFGCCVASTLIACGRNEIEEFLITVSKRLAALLERFKFSLVLYFLTNLSKISYGMQL